MVRNAIVYCSDFSSYKTLIVLQFINSRLVSGVKKERMQTVRAVMIYLIMMCYDRERLLDCLKT